MAQLIPLQDSQAVQDVLTFAGRAGRVADEGIRLQASGGVLRVSTATLAPKGLLDATPIVLGMRITSTDPELVCDIVVGTGSLEASEDASGIRLPDSAILPAWAGVAPPQSGWEPAGTVSGVEVMHIATLGIDAVAAAMPTNPGEDVVRTVRAGIWAVLDDALGGAPRGAAFAADALGFVKTDDQVQVFRTDRWTRLSTGRGHVLSRGPARAGLSPVFSTGSAQRQASEPGS